MWYKWPSKFELTYRNHHIALSVLCLLRCVFEVERFIGEVFFCSCDTLTQLYPDFFLLLQRQSEQNQGELKMRKQSNC